MTINILDLEEIQNVLNGEEAVHSVNLLGYKEYLKIKHPGKVLYPFFQDDKSIHEYLELIMDYNKKYNSVLLPYYESQASIFEDRTHEFFNGNIIGTSYVENDITLSLSTVVNDFIELTLLNKEDNVHFGSINFSSLIGRAVAL